MDTLMKIAQFFEQLITHAHFTAILLGLVISTGFTQFMKYPIRMYFFRKGLDPDSKVTPEIEVDFHRWVVRAVAVVAGIFATFFVWPDERLTFKVIWSIASGLACPTLYSVTVHYVPWLGDRATADRVLHNPPSPPDDTQ